MRTYPKTTILVALILIAALLTFQERRLLLVAAFSSTPELLDAAQEPDSVSWFDDYFTIEYIDAKTVAIGEPRYHQQNYNYLIIGDEQAILFDTGPGIRDIRPVVEALTSLPIIVTQSHLHYDHVGNHKLFKATALPDLAHLRDASTNGRLTLTTKQHLGFAESIEAPVLTVSDWWAADSHIDLGNRTIKVIHTPGHTPDSMVLLDSENKLLFTGDFIYPGPLFAMLPGSSLTDYLNSTRRLVSAISADTRLLAAHRSGPPGAPILAFDDLVDLQNGLEGVMDGTLEGDGFYLHTYPINERIELWAD